MAKDQYWFSKKWKEEMKAKILMVNPTASDKDIDKYFRREI